MTLFRGMVKVQRNHILKIASLLLTPRANREAIIIQAKTIFAQEGNRSPPPGKKYVTAEHNRQSLT